MANLQERLREETREKIRGAALPSRIKWLEDGERSTSFFLNLEKLRQVKKVMQKIPTNDGVFITEHDSIMREQVRFYSNLYTSEPSDDSRRKILLNHLSKRLSEPVSKSCEGSITVQELKNALFDMDSNKSPGLDRLTSEFYKEFWDVLCDIFLRLTKEIL